MHDTIELNDSASDTHSRRIWRRPLTIIEWALAMILTMAAVWFHVLRFLRAGALWRDEVGALNVARLPLREMVSYFPHEAFPLLFPTIVRGYTAVAGASEVSLRLFGLGVGLVLLAIIWLNARLLRVGVPLVSIALVGMSPLFFMWGDTIRGYGLGAALIMLTFGLLGYSIIRPRPFVFCAAGLCALSSVHCLLGNAVVLFALCLAAAITQAYQKRVAYALVTMGIGVIAAASMLPYVSPYSHSRDWDVVLHIPIRLDLLLSNFFDALGSPNKKVLRVWAVGFLASGVGIIWFLPKMSVNDLKDRAVSMFALLVSVLAIPCYCAYLWILSYEPADWYYLALIAMLIMSMDTIIGIAATRWISMRLAQMSVAVSMLAFSAFPDLAIARIRMTNLDLIAADLKHNAAREDVILLLPWVLGVSFERYYQGVATWETLPHLDDFRMHRYDLMKEKMTLTNPLGEVMRQLTDTLRSGHRLWIVSTEDFAPMHPNPPQLTPAPSDLVGWLESSYRAAWTEELGFFLQKHAGNLTIPSEESPQINSFENARLVLVEGWSD